MSERSEIMKKPIKPIVMLIILMLGFQFTYTTFVSAAISYLPDII